MLGIGSAYAKVTHTFKEARHLTTQYSAPSAVVDGHYSTNIGVLLYRGVEWRPSAIADGTEFNSL